MATFYDELNSILDEVSSFMDPQKISKMSDEEIGVFVKTKSGTYKKVNKLKEVMKSYAGVPSAFDNLKEIKFVRISLYLNTKYANT
jgi:hypothetical protein